MSKNEKSRAHQLISSMTKEEKRYFKLFAQGVGKKGSQSIQLFDVLARQKNYSSTAAKRQLKHIKNYGSTEKYLYQLLLKALRLYWQQKHPSLAVLDELKNIYILYNKHLYDLAQEHVYQSQAHIAEHHQLLYRPLLLEWELHLQNNIFKFKEQEEADFAVLKANYLESFQLLQDYSQHVITTSEFNFLIQKLGYSKAAVQCFSDLLEASEVPQNTNPASLAAQLQWHEIKALAYKYQQPLKSLEHYWQMVKAVELAGLGAWAQYCEPYMMAAANAGFIAVKERKWEDVQQILARADLIPKDQLKSRYKLFEYTLQLSLFIQQGNLSVAAEVRQQGIDFLELCEENLPQVEVANWWYLAAILYFLEEDYEATVDCLEELYNDASNKEQQHAARILTLISIYEQDKGDLWDYFARSNYRFFQKNSTKNSFEQMMVHRLKRLMTTKWAKLYPQQLQQMQTYLTEYYQEHQVWHLYLPYSFDYLAWIQAKLEGVSMAELLQKLALVEKSQ